MEVTATDVTRIPVRNLRVPRGEFVAVWTAAEHYCAAHPADWYSAGVVTTCRWLAGAMVRPAVGSWYMQWSPVTQRDGSAYEELIEAECLATEVALCRQPPHLWTVERPGWLRAIRDTFEWAWRRCGVVPVFDRAPSH